MLGLSLGTVLHMVGSGTLTAWKTDGGHRRINVASVKEQLRRRIGTSALARSSYRETLSLLITEDDAALQKLYQLKIGNWNLPISLQIVGNGFEGLVQIGQQAPDVLIVDLMMPEMDGFEMIRAMRANPLLQAMDIIVVTGMSRDTLADRGGLPLDVTVYGKPIPFDQLRGYVQAKLSQRLRDQSTAL